MSSTNEIQALTNLAQRTLYDPAEFGRLIGSLGYQFSEQTPWGSLVFAKSDYRFVLSTSTTKLHNLQLRCESEGKTYDIVKDGVLM